MKKALSLVVVVFLISSVSFLTIACQNPLVRTNSSETTIVSSTLSNLVVKDIKYYQQEIKQNKGHINDCNKILEEIEENKISSNDDKDLIDEITAQKYAYKNKINDLQYQILLLEKGDGDFNPQQVLQRIIIFAEKVDNLEQELQLKEKYSKYYGKELKKIENEIKVAKEILATFMKVAEEKNVTIKFN